MLVHDYDFKPSQDKASIERGIKFLEETQKNLQSGKFSNSNGMYKIIGKSHENDVRVLTGACHFSIGSGTENCDLVATLTHRLDKYPSHKAFGNTHSQFLVNPEIVEKFTRWFTQQSFYSRFFVPMPLEFNTEFGLLISSDIPAGILQNMCIISRHTREKAPYLRFWSDLVDGGMDPDIAFVIATNTTDCGKNDGFGPGSNGHFTLPTQLSIKDAAFRAIGGDFYGLTNKDKTYRNYHSIYGGSQYFVTGKLLPLDSETWQQHWMTQVNNLLDKKPETIMSSIPNPFKKRVASSVHKSLIPTDRFKNEIVPRFVEEVQNLLQERKPKSVEDNLQVAA